MWPDRGVSWKRAEKNLYIDGGYIRHDTRKPSKYGKEH